MVSGFMMEPDAPMMMGWPRTSPGSAESEGPSRPVTQVTPEPRNNQPPGCGYITVISPADGGFREQT
jgi:hypothetical protein